jgi:hypothetical protein
MTSVGTLIRQAAFNDQIGVVHVDKAILAWSCVGITHHFTYGRR